jgi:hypothetical protein
MSNLAPGFSNYRELFVSAACADRFHTACTDSDCSCFCHEQDEKGDHDGQDT